MACKICCCLSILVIYMFVPVRGQTRQDFIQALLNGYDNRIPPNFERDVSTDVSVRLYVNNIDSINEQTMDFSLSTFVMQEWYDTRLQFFNLIDAEYLELDSRLMADVWVPDLYFSNEKRASFHEVTTPNRMLHLYKDGKLLYRSRVSMTAACPMKLHKYPLDTQICSLYLQSFAYSTKSIVFKWDDDNPVETNPLLELPQFTLMKNEIGNCSEAYMKGNFTCIRVDFHLERRIGFYMIQIYIPSLLIVLLSWVSFWLNVDSVPARISLGILTVLTMTTQKSLAVSSLPRVSYVKAIDVWMAACLCFVFSALLEFALVNVIDRRQVKKRKTLHRLVDINIETQTLMSNGKKPVTQAKLEKETVRRANKVDQASRVFFPLSFVCFTIVYWLYYIKA